jgi:deoxyribonuclease-4
MPGTQNRILGAHLSTAGGPNKGVDRATAINANALQLFSGSPRSWGRKPVDDPELIQKLQEFKKYGEEQGVRDFFIHSLYLVNLGSGNTELVQKSKNALIYDLKFGEYFGCKGAVVHLGSHLGNGWDAVDNQIIQLLKEIIDAADSSVPLLIENSAGQNGKLCSQLDEIRQLIDAVDRGNKLGWCYDTCHGWAAGFTATNYSEPEKESVDLFAEIEENKLWEYLQLIHVNDSRDPFHSGKDRHANIGEGTIPAAEMKAIINHEKLKEVPLILEVPGQDKEGPDAVNIERVRQFLV